MKKVFENIDEAIAKYKEITNTDSNCPAHCNISCDKCVQESEQLAEWLEELKSYRAHIFSGDIGCQDQSHHSHISRRESE